MGDGAINGRWCHTWKVVPYMEGETSSMEGGGTSTSMIGGGAIQAEVVGSGRSSDTLPGAMRPFLESMSGSLVAAPRVGADCDIRSVARMASMCSSSCATCGTTQEEATNQRGL
eukprot:2658067-Prymnesium_polylepis.1